MQPRFPRRHAGTAAPARHLCQWRRGDPLADPGAGGLDGKPIAFDGLSAARIDVLVRLAAPMAPNSWNASSRRSRAFTAVASPGPFEVVRTYTVLGVEHILIGFDHLLFVLALVMIVRACGSCC